MTDTLLQDYTVEDFDMDDFTYYHQELLAERNGQWLDENGNTSLWLSQGCYISMKCIVTGTRLSFPEKNDRLFGRSLSISWPRRALSWGDGVGF